MTQYDIDKVINQCLDHDSLAETHPDWAKFKERLDRTRASEIGAAWIAWSWFKEGWSAQKNVTQSNLIKGMFDD